MTKSAVRFGRELMKVGVARVASWSGFQLLRQARLVTAGPKIHVLGYHRVVDDVVMDGPINPALCISSELFRRQMEQVRRDFRVLTLDEVMRALDGNLALDRGRDACAITFDDGYRDVLLRAHPILAELDIPAAVFVPSGYVGTSRYLTHDRLYAAFWEAQRRGLPIPGATPADAVEAMIAKQPARLLAEMAAALEETVGKPRLDSGAEVLAIDELHALAAAGCEIGAHTVGHVVLTHEPLERAREELVRSKRELESWTGKPCRFFAYCNGFHSPRLVEELQRAGYTGAVTTCDRPNRRGGDRMRVARKVLWEGHARGLDGRFSESVSSAHLHDLFGTLGLTRPVDGEVPTAHQEVIACAR